MPNKIADLKAALGSGARASKYLVGFSIPNSVPTTSQLQNAAVLCKATSFPSMAIGMIEVFCQGRKLPIPGDTTYTNAWTLTFLTTEDHGLRRDIISWMKSCDNFQENKHSGDPSAVLGELSVSQLDSSANETAKYTFHNVFPSDIGELTQGSDQIDTLLEFDVTFSFSDWVVGDGEINDPSKVNSPTLNATAN